MRNYGFDEIETRSTYLSELQVTALLKCIDIYNNEHDGKANSYTYADRLDTTNDTDVDCSQVMRFPQLSGTCWFNALLMALFYSQGMRRVLVDKFDKWDQITDAFSGIRATFRTIMERHYTGKSFDITTNAYILLSMITPEVILQNLHSANSSTFEFDPLRKEGYYPWWYIRKLIGLLQVSNVTVLEASATAEPLKYDLRTLVFAQHEKDQLRKQGFNKNVSPDTELLIITFGERYGVNNNDDKVAYGVSLIGAEHGIVTVNNVDFIIDSFVISNDTKTRYQGRGHVMAGVTCNKKRFMYNGWDQNTVDPARAGTTTTTYPDPYPKSLLSIPCPLFDFDWLDKNNSKSFCPSSSACALKMDVDDSRELCFRITGGDRIYLAVNAAKFDLYPKAFQKPNGAANGGLIGNTVRNSAVGGTRRISKKLTF